MSQFEPQEFIIHNQTELADLAGELEAVAGQFALLVARCNYAQLRDGLIERLQQICPLRLRVVRVAAAETSLYTRVLAAVQAEMPGARPGERPEAIMVVGLETVTDLARSLATANQVREEFRNACPVPIVFWVTDGVMQTWVQAAPDLESWATKTYFTLPPQALAQVLAMADRWFERWLDPAVQEAVGQGESLSGGGLQPLEMAAALQELRQQGQTLDPALQADLALAEGLNATDPVEALGLFERSLAFWQGEEESPPSPPILGGTGIQSPPGYSPDGHSRKGDLGGRDLGGDGVEGPPSPPILGGTGIQSPPSLGDLGGRDLGIDRAPLKVGLLWAYIARSRFAIAETTSQTPDWSGIRALLERAIGRFEGLQRSELVGFCIPQLERVLQKLQAWSALEATARRGLELHGGEGNRTRLSQDYGFLARALLEQQQWDGARAAAQQALAVLDGAPAALNWLRGLYRLFLAQAERGLGNGAGAIAQLTEANAQEVSDQGYPKPAIRILALLRELYFEQRQYGLAFEAKQAGLSIEQQYGLRAFVGAGRLQAQRQAVVTEFAAPTGGQVAPEIAAAGRQQDLARLVERVERRDNRLNVIHGGSGVGKSSLVNAGLVPMLRQRPIAARDNLPVVVRVYTQWVDELAAQLQRELAIYRDRRYAPAAGTQVASPPIPRTQALPGRALPEALPQGGLEAEPPMARSQAEPEERGEIPRTQALPGRARSEALPQVGREAEPPMARSQAEPEERGDPSGTALNQQALLAQLRELDQCNLRTVLIFDQFEEFFFVYPQPEDRQRFFEFLVECLQILSVKVFLSLREDYLHYLLELGRLPGMRRTGIDLLSQNVLYELGNFDPTDATAIMQSLTTRARFHLEPALVERLVADLAQELGTVRPIELQVVGAQVQAEGIQRLTQYEALGAEPKFRLVQGYLAAAVADCGVENQQLAELVLFLLTDERGTRPLKTRAELEKELQALTTIIEDQNNSSLDLVLKIFVDSGLVVLLPETPADRYQLIHDYLANFIRQNQKAEIVEELRRSKEELNQVLKQKLRDSRIAGGIVGVLAILAIGLGVKFAFNTSNEKLNLLSQSSGSLFDSNRNFDALITSIKAGKQLKRSLGVDPDTQTKILTTLQQAIHGVKESNSLEGHNRFVSSISISPNGTIASISGDGTIKLWSSDGKELKTLRQGKDNSNFEPNEIQFSPNGQLLAFTNKDDEIELWNLNGKKQQSFKEHTAWVTGISFSPDGKMLASASKDKTIKLWNTSNGKKLKTLRGHTDSVFRVRFSPDGKLLASASQDKTIKLWSVDSAKKKTLRGHTSWVSDVRFSPDGKTIVSASSDWTIKLWSIDGKELQTLRGHSDVVSAASFSPDSRTIASASTDKTIKLWNISGEELQTLEGHSDQINDVVYSVDGKTIISASTDRSIKLWAIDQKSFHPLRGHIALVDSVNFSPDGNLIASASNSDGTIKLWDMTGKELKTIGDYSGWINGISFSPDGKTLATGSSDNAIKLWSLGGRKLKTFEGHTGNVWGISFSPDGNLIASASTDKTIKLWNRDGEELETFKGHTNDVRGVSFSPDGNLIASASVDRTIKLWNRHGGEPKRTLNGHTDQVNSVSFSPNGKWLVSGSGDKTVKFWTIDGQEKWSKEFDDWITTVRFSPDGKSIIATCGDGAIRLLNLDGSIILTFRGHSSYGSYSANFSPDGQSFISGGSDNLVKLWALDGTLRQTFPDQQYRRHTNVNGISFSPDGKTIASASADSTIKLWNLERKELQTLQGHSNSVINVSFSPDGTILASASLDGTIKLWDSRGRALRTLKGHEGVVYDISFSPDGKWIASASEDKTIKLWNLAEKNSHPQTFRQEGEVYDVSFSPDGQLIASASKDGNVKLHTLDGKVRHAMSKHLSAVNQVNFSPDGQLIASASEDRTIKLWDLNGRELRTFKGHGNIVNTVHFSRDGKKLISSSNDGTVKLWNLDGYLIQTVSGSGNMNSYSSAFDANFSPDGQMIAVATSNDGIVLWNMNLDTLLAQACTKARAYLSTSSIVEEKDKHLCDDIPAH